MDVANIADGYYMDGFDGLIDAAIPIATGRLVGRGSQSVTNHPAVPFLYEQSIRETVGGYMKSLDGNHDEM